MPNAPLTLETALRDLAAQLRTEIDALVEQGTRRMREEIPEFFLYDDDPDFVETYRQSYVQQLAFILDGLGLGRDRSLEDREPPAYAIEEVRMSANRGIDLAPMMLGYRITQRLLYERVIEAVWERIDDDALRADVLLVTSRWLFAYMDWITSRMTAVYQRERDLLLRDRARRRQQLVRDLLEGQPVDTGQLGYSLHQEHLGVVAWGREPQRALAALKEATQLALLSVAGTETTVWGWLGHGEIGKRELRAMREFQPPIGVQLAIGEPGSGREGFCVTHRQAWNAYRIARSSSDPVTWHADVALLALTLQDHAVAREFVLRELGPLADGEERSRLLRDTLSAYFASGQNATATAAALGVHDRTVLYRLRSIEDRLGRPILKRREELGVALRLAPVVLR
jgi:hypothetical protein